MYAPMDNDFPTWLRKEREKRNWSPSDLSRFSNVSRQTISDYEGRKRKYYDENVLSRLAHALKFPPEIVFRAAGILPPKPEEDPWVAGLSHQISMIPKSFRGTAGPMLEAIVEGFIEAENGTSKGARAKPKTKTSNV